MSHPGRVADPGQLTRVFVQGGFPAWYYGFIGGMLTLILFSDRLFSRLSTLLYRQIFADDVAFEARLVPSGIDLRSKVVTGPYAWSSIKRMIETDSHLIPADLQARGGHRAAACFDGRGSFCRGTGFRASACDSPGSILGRWVGFLACSEACGLSGLMTAPAARQMLQTLTPQA